MTARIKGNCLCGGVAYNIAPTHHVDACHCKFCQRWTGSAFIGVDIRDGDIQFEKDETLSWFDSSEWAKRGFCNTCGSSLFYKLNDVPDFWAVAAGTLDLPKDTEMVKEIFIDSQPDYYAFAGDRPRQTGEEVFAEIQEAQNSND